MYILGRGDTFHGRAIEVRLLQESSAEPSTDIFHLYNI